MGRNKRLLVQFVFFVLIACRSNHSPELQKKVIDHICYEGIILPKPFLEQADTIELADLIYLKFTVYEEKGNKRIQELFKPSNYSNLLYYVNTKMAGDFKMIQGTREYNPVQVYFENNNRISNKLVFLVAFEKTDIKSKEEVSLKFSDNLFNNGMIYLKFNSI